MQYFQLFPKIGYTSTEKLNNIPQVIQRSVPNMTVKLELNVLKDGVVSFETYRIKDGDRPDTVSAQMYGVSRYAWVVLLANNMRDWFDWPLTDLQFYNYISQKYETVAGANDGFAESQTIVYQYIWITDDDRELVVDETTYLSLDPERRRLITMYDNEYNLNDERRLIRLISLEALPDVLRQFDQAMSV